MSNEDQITIIMPKESLEKWLTALESGSYQQGYGALKSGMSGYCCLGVLQHCLSGSTERCPKGNDIGLPSDEWLNRHNIRFTNRIIDRDSNPYIPSKEESLAYLNDTRKLSFKELAEVIRKHAKGV